jgi:hypothetical protein
MVAYKLKWQNVQPYLTVTNNSCPHSIVSTITHKLHVSGHTLMWISFPFWYMELVPKVCLHLLVTPVYTPPHPCSAGARSSVVG